MWEVSCLVLIIVQDRKTAVQHHGKQEYSIVIMNYHGMGVFVTTLIYVSQIIKLGIYDDLYV